LCESCKVCVNEIVECGGEVVVDVRCVVHGMKRSGVRGVREEDRHHRQVLVTVELSLVLFHRVEQSSYSYT
jgi:hypothetical protein